MKPASSPTVVLPKPAVVAVLGELTEKRHRPAELVATDGRWMVLRIEESLPSGTPLRVDVEGGLVLGTAVSTEPLDSGVHMRVEIDQIIPDTVSLSRLVSAVLGQTLPPPVLPDNGIVSEQVEEGIYRRSR